MISAPVQRKFDYQVQAAAPLMPVEGAMAIIRCDAVACIDKCDSGFIPWAFDLSAKPDRKRRMVHIFFDSLLAYANGDFARIEELKKVPLEKIIATILPKPTIKALPDCRYKTIRVVELALRFSCCPPHIMNLCAVGELMLSPLQVKTPKHSPFVDYESAVSFLTRREISMPASAPETALPPPVKTGPALIWASQQSKPSHE
jgi:hypothetical protein